MADKFQNLPDGASQPARKCWVIAPHDVTALPDVTKAMRAAAAGTITFRAIDSAADVAHPVLAGERIDVRATHVRATGTTVAIIGYA